MQRVISKFRVCPSLLYPSLPFPSHLYIQVSSLQEEIRQLKEKNQQLGVEVKKRDNAISSLKTDIEGLRREIQERDDTIQDKVEHCTTWFTTQLGMA